MGVLESQAELSGKKKANNKNAHWMDPTDDQIKLSRKSVNWESRRNYIDCGTGRERTWEREAKRILEGLRASKLHLQIATEGEQCREQQDSRVQFSRTDGKHLSPG